MLYGIDFYFRHERALARRTSAIAAAFSIALLGLLLLTQTPVIQARIQRATRFGLEGQARYVQRIRLIERSGTSTRPSVMILPGQSTSRGGSTRKVSRRGTATRSVERHDPRPGESLAEIGGDTPSLRSQMPFVDENDLIILYRVEPIFPDEARARDLEGQVMLLAVLDTTGAVRDVDVLSSPDRSLSDAAAIAVRQWLFRPYRIAGIASEVQVLFPFRFTIDRD
jgi:TonB family protein